MSYSKTPLVYSAEKSRRVENRSTQKNIRDKGPSINYVVSKSAIFYPLPLSSFLLSRVYVGNRLWGYIFEDPLYSEDYYHPT